MPANLYKVKFIICHDFISHLSLISIFGVFEHNQTYRIMCEKMECKPASLSDSMEGLGPHTWIFCHLTLKTKCECWSMSLACITTPMILDIVRILFL